MKTYKIEPEKATSLRKQLLWTNICAFVSVILMAFFAGGDVMALAGLFTVIALIAFVWSVFAYWKSLWNLWEWQGIGLGLLVGLAVGIGNALTGFVGFFISIAFFIYVYVKLGNQTGEPRPPKREVIEDI